MKSKSYEFTFFYVPNFFPTHVSTDQHLIKTLKFKTRDLLSWRNLEKLGLLKGFYKNGSIDGIGEYRIVVKATSFFGYEATLYKNSLF